MSDHPHFAQIQDLLKTGPELAVQVCLGVTETREQAKELFVEACLKATRVRGFLFDWGYNQRIIYRPNTEQVVENWQPLDGTPALYYASRPWDTEDDDLYLLSCFDAYCIDDLRELCRIHYRIVFNCRARTFDQQTQ